MIPTLFMAAILVNASADVVAAENREDIRVLMIFESAAIQNATSSSLVANNFRSENIVVKNTFEDASEIISTTSFGLIIVEDTYNSTAISAISEIRPLTDGLILVVAHKGAVERLMQYKKIGVNSVIVIPFSADFLNRKLEEMGL